MRIYRIARDAWRILRLGCFSHAAYALSNLGSRTLAPLALLHFLCVGERKGLRPNAFFDPAHFSAASGGGTYADYLGDPRLWIHSTSSLFDADYYLERHSGEVPTYANPLTHFMREGFAADLVPSRVFETAFVRRCLLRDERAVGQALYDASRAGAVPPCFNEAALRAAQRGFLGKITVHACRIMERPRNRDLVLVQAGRGYAARFDKGRRFDVLVNYYEPAFPLTAGADYVFRQRGTKCTAVAKLLETYRAILLGYDSVMLLDDDVVISTQQIERLFDLRAEHRLDLLQPSLTSRSATHFPFLRQPLAGSGLRPMTAVEIMMPIVSRRVFVELGSLFEESVSGWGLDLLLGKAVRERFGETVAMAADIHCEHREPVDLRNGRLYRFLGEAGISPAAEVGRIAASFHLNDKMNAIRPLETVAAPGAFS